MHWDSGRSAPRTNAAGDHDEEVDDHHEEANDRIHDRVNVVDDKGDTDNDEEAGGSQAGSPHSIPRFSKDHPPDELHGS